MMNYAPNGKMIAATVIGNVIEWYDFAIYGNFAASIGHNFFPRENGVAQLLAVFGVFAIGYLVRPIGGAVKKVAAPNSLRVSGRIVRAIG
jgi:MFS transporter, MHS family, proline/betaine transporter